MSFNLPCLLFLSFSGPCEDNGFSSRNPGSQGGHASSSAGGGGGGGGQEQELATKMLQIQSKRFYLDVKENRRGKFIKVSSSPLGRHVQLFDEFSIKLD